MSGVRLQIKTKRIYDAPHEDDGLRVLVDRLWPRGMRKDKAAIDVWAKELAPTTGLRTWFRHDSSKFDEFKRRYLDELGSKTTLIDQLLDQAGARTITLLYAARDETHNHANVLRSMIATSAKAHFKS